MLLDDEKLDRLEERLGVSTALEVLRQSLDSTNSPEVRVWAAMALMLTWHSALDDETKQNRLTKIFRAVGVDHAALSEQLAEQLLCEGTADNAEFESSNGVTRDENSATKTSPGGQNRVSLAKTVPPAKTAPQKKPVTPAKTKPKQDIDPDESPRIKKGYWVILSVLIVILAGYLFTLSSPPSPAQLATRALTSTDATDRSKAIAELCRSQDPDVPAQLRRLAKDSKDLDVLIEAFGCLGTIPAGTETIELCVSGLEHTDVKVREAASGAIRKLTGFHDPNVFAYKADDASENRAAGIASLKKLLKPAPVDPTTKQ